MLKWVLEIFSKSISVDFVSPELHTNVKIFFHGDSMLPVSEDEIIISLRLVSPVALTILIALHLKNFTILGDLGGSVS